MLDRHTARQRWAGLSIAERKDLIFSVSGDQALADHDWAGLPPQAHHALAIAMDPAHEATAEPDPEATEDAKAPTRKKR